MGKRTCKIFTIGICKILLTIGIALIIFGGLITAINTCHGGISLCFITRFAGGIIWNFISWMGIVLVIIALVKWNYENKK